MIHNGQHTHLVWLLLCSRERNLWNLHPRNGTSGFLLKVGLRGCVGAKWWAFLTSSFHFNCWDFFPVDVKSFKTVLGQSTQQRTPPSPPNPRACLPAPHPLRHPRSPFTQSSPPPRRDRIFTGRAVTELRKAAQRTGASFMKWIHRMVSFVWIFKLELAHNSCEFKKKNLTQGT